jgi:hypothetical protein
MPNGGGFQWADVAISPAFERYRVKPAGFGKLVIFRRSILKSTAAAFSGPMINSGRFSLFAQSETEYSARTVDLLRPSTAIHMLGLVTFELQEAVSASEPDPGRFQQAG